MNGTITDATTGIVTDDASGEEAEAPARTANGERRAVPGAANEVLAELEELWLWRDLRTAAVATRVEEILALPGFAPPVAFAARTVRAALHARRGEMPAALEQVEIARGLGRVGADAWRARLDACEATCCGAMGDPEGTHALLERALEGARACGERLDEFGALLNLGVYYLKHTTRHDTALTLFERAQGICAGLARAVVPRYPEEILRLAALATRMNAVETRGLLGRLGGAAQAEELQTIGRDAEAVGCDSLAVTAYVTASGALTSLGATGRALALLESAAAPAGASDDLQAQIAFARGAALERAGRPGAAREAYERALATTVAGIDLSREIAIRRALARASRDVGDTNTALEQMERAFDLRERFYDRTTAERVAMLEVRYQTRLTRREAELERQRREQLEANVRELEALNRRVRELSLRDALTGLPNRRSFDEVGAQLLRSAERSGRGLALALLDLDRFKRVNDDFSHGVGDRVLRRFARLLLDGARASDLVVRLGGEEFVLLLPDTDGAAAVRACGRLLGSVREHAWNEIAAELRVTASAGVASFEPGDDLASLLERADARLYDAKRGGRDRVVG